jgi:hypothetical protein
LENLFVGFILKFQSTLKSVAQLMLRKDKMMKGVRIGPMKQNQGIRIGLITKKTSALLSKGEELEKPHPNPSLPTISGLCSEKELEDNSEDCVL